MFALKQTDSNDETICHVAADRLNFFVACPQLLPEGTALIDCAATPGAAHGELDLAHRHANDRPRSGDVDLAAVWECPLGHGAYRSVRARHSFLPAFTPGSALKSPVSTSFLRRHYPDQVLRSAAGPDSPRPPAARFRRLTRAGDSRLMLRVGWPDGTGLAELDGATVPSRMSGNSLRCTTTVGSKRGALVFLGQDVTQLAGEGFGLASASRVATHEAPVMAGEDRRLLPKEFGRGHRRACGKGLRGLFAHSDHYPCRCRGQRVEVGAIACDRPRNGQRAAGRHGSRHPRSASRTGRDPVSIARSILQ